MKKSAIRTEKRPKKFRLLRAFSILFYDPRPFRPGRFFRPAPRQNPGRDGQKKP